MYTLLFILFKLSIFLNNYILIFSILLTVNLISSENKQVIL